MDWFASLDLNVVWFLLLGVLFTGYAVLDGFDLGVGILHPFARSDERRRILLNAIGPVWDGNEVWLVAGGGALFAAFPNVYATIFSGFYLAFIYLLFALIFRAVAIEFRSKQPAAWWKHFWDFSFFLASLSSAFLIGVVLGNLIWGIPISADGEYAGTLFGLIHPYSLLTAVLTVALFTMHGAIYLMLKTEGDFQAEIYVWVRRACIFFIVAYVVATQATLIYVPRMIESFKQAPVFFLLPAATLLAVANIPREMFHRRYFQAFLSSASAIISLMALLGLGIFPNLVVSSSDPALHLTIYNAASSPKTLAVMLVVALIGMPLVLSYTFSIYWIFRGKVKLEPSSY